MKRNYLQGMLACLCLCGCVLPQNTIAQTKTQYSSLTDAISTGRILRGKSGPRNIDWINGGNQYSFAGKDGISSMDPATLKESVIFNNADLKYPGTDKPCEYEKFDWTHDFKHLVFQTNFRKIYRRS